MKYFEDKKEDLFHEYRICIQFPVFSAIMIAPGYLLYTMLGIVAINGRGRSRR